MKLKARNSKQLGHAIRQLRRKKGLTQKQLAKLAGVRQPTVSDVENGKRSFTDILLRLLNSLGAEMLFEFLDGNREVFNPKEFYSGQKEKGD